MSWEYNVIHCSDDSLIERMEDKSQEMIFQIHYSKFHLDELQKVGLSREDDFNDKFERWLLTQNVDEYKV